MKRTTCSLLTLSPIHAAASVLCALALLAPGPGTTTRAATTAPPPDPGDDTVSLRVSPEREFIYRRGPREVMLEIEVKAKRSDSTHHTPVNVSVVLDHSGSMAGAKIEKARQAARAALDTLEPDDYFSLVIFDDTCELLLAPERAGSREHRDRLKDKIDRIQPAGGTGLHAGVQMGAKQVRRFLDKERVNRVILVSDGLANVGPSRPRDLAELGRDLRGEGMSVATIGLGEDFNEDLMTALAESSHANYYYVKDAERLPGILTDELGAAGSRVADNVRIRVEVPAGVRLREVAGHPEIECRERSAEIALPEMFGAEQRLFHLRCSLDDTAADSTPLASVSLAYDDTATGKRRNRDYAANVRLTDDKTRSEDSVRNEVAKNVNVLRNRMAKEEAVKLADAGRAKEAASVLQSQAAVNAAAPAAQQQAGVADENRKLNNWAAELLSRGSLGNTSRKAAQYDNYQDKYQKKQAPDGNR